MVRKFDFLVIGSGIAGMSFALKVAHKGSVALICKAGMEEANTYFAQGGIASVTNLKVDNFEKHIHDTMVAGDWISDPAAVEKVITNAPKQIEELIKWGVDFDKNEKGEFDLHKEGGHSEFRILHHKDNTGAEIQTSLIEAVKQHPNITIFSNFYAVELITQHHLGIIVTRHTPGIKCFGAYILNEETGEVDTFLSKVTVMATGGCEAVYPVLTVPGPWTPGHAFPQLCLHPSKSNPPPLNATEDGTSLPAISLSLLPQICFNPHGNDFAVGCSGRILVLRGRDWGALGTAMHTACLCPAHRGTRASVTHHLHYLPHRNSHVIG